MDAKTELDGCYLRLDPSERELDRIEIEYNERHLSKVRRQAINHRWAYDAQREEFLSEVFFDPLRNEYFKARYDRAMAGINDGYRLKKQGVPGKYHGIEAVMVKNSHNDKVYSVRLFKNGGVRGLASCTCPDFQRNKAYKVPCKHIWMVLLKGPCAGNPIVGWR